MKVGLSCFHTKMAHRYVVCFALGRRPIITTFRSPQRILCTTYASTPEGTASTAKKEMKGHGLMQHPGHDPIDLSFTETVNAFKSKTNWELLRGWFILTMCSFEYLMKNNKTILDGLRMMMPDIVFSKIMKATVYGQFVAGEDEDKIQPAMKRLSSFAVKPILDYSAEDDAPEEEPALPTPETKPPVPGDENEDATLSEALGRRVEKDDALKMFGKDVKERHRGVTSARTFYYHGEAQCEKNMEIFLKSIETVANTTGGAGFGAIKVTALGRPQILLQVSEALMRTRRYIAEIVDPDISTKDNLMKSHIHPETFKERLAEKLPSKASEAIEDMMKNLTYDQHGIINFFSWGGLIEQKLLLSDLCKVPSLTSGKMTPLISSLSSEEEKMFANLVRRMDTIFKLATNCKVRVMVDAEQTYFQPAISRLTMEMMRKYNKEYPIVWNTYQCYLKNAFSELQLDLEQASRQNFYFGAKLVRGAYMDQERERAELLNYEDPINPDYEATSAMYYKCMDDVIKRAAEAKRKQGPNEFPRVSVVIASHNEDTIRHAVKSMEELEIGPADRVISFGQLYGMCDHMSFPLGQGGYSVYKYVPYGPILEVLPYMSRRITENGGNILMKGTKEKKMLLREWGRRMATMKWFHKPEGNYKPTPSH